MPTNDPNKVKPSRVETILMAMLGEAVEIDEPKSRVEELLLQLKELIEQGVGPEGGIILVGETTTALIDGARTNPIMVNGNSYTAQSNDAVIYGNKEFLFDGTKWHEFGDLSGLESKDIGAMTGYAKASTGSAIATTDTLNQAIGKLEKRVSDNEDTIGNINSVLEEVL